MKHLFSVGILGLMLVACGTTAAEPTPTSPASSSSDESASPSSLCAVSDQDQYVYHPARLQVINPCLRVTGTVLAIRPEADGDLHIRVKVDPAFADLLTPANQQQCAQNACGLLVVEPVCIRTVTQSDAIAICQADPDPLTSLPAVGQHVWLEGQYVLDTQHGSWAELHPLFRWGVN